MEQRTAGALGQQGAQDTGEGVQIRGGHQVVSFSKSGYMMETFLRL
jgi:hypothetical protein